MPLAPLVHPFAQADIYKMLGPMRLAAQEAADASALSGDLSGLNVYRDVTLSGTVTPGIAGLVIICRALNLAGNIIDGDGRGCASGTSATKGGQGVLSTIVSNDYLPAVSASIAPATGVPYDPTQHLLAAGGAGGNGGGANAGGTGANAVMTIRLVLALLYGGGIDSTLLFGGGAGLGALGSVGGGGTGGAAGRRGFAGTNGSNVESGGGGGSGVSGGGGGGGCNGGTGIGAAAGAGGGAVIIICDTILGTTGTVRCRGTAGSSPGSGNGGGGGGGGGGVAVIFAGYVIVTPTLQATGGSGGAGVSGGNGGAGGNGFTQLVTA